jgi:hypothetical protein
MQVLPGLEPGLQGSKPWVLTNYTIEPYLSYPAGVAGFDWGHAPSTLPIRSWDRSQKQKMGSPEVPHRLSTPTRFELARAEPIGFQNQLLNHSDTVSSYYCIQQRKKSSTPTRFELARAEPSRFRIYLLNHSDTVSWSLDDSASKA